MSKDTNQFTNVNPVDSKYLQPIFPDSSLTEQQYSQQIDDSANELVKYLTSLTPQNQFQYNNTQIDKTDFQNSLKSMLVNPLVRVPDTKFWKSYFSAILQNPENPESWLNQLQIKQLQDQNLPWPDPINAIYEFEGDIKPILKQMQTGTYQISDYFSANMYAYLMQYLPTSILRIAVLPDKQSESRLWSSLKANGVPNIDSLIKYSLHNILSIFKLSPDNTLNSGYRLLNDALNPYLLNPTLGTLFTSTYFLITDAESLSNATEDDMRLALNKTANQFNSILQFSLIPTNQLEALPAVVQSTNKTHEKPDNQSSQDLMQLANNFTVPKQRTNPLTTVKVIDKIMQKFTDKQETAYKFSHKKHSFLMSNRRHPDNINLPGKRKFFKYRPNIMIHLDTSGSVQESEYQEAVLSILFVAKKLNIPIYFQTFADHVTDIMYLDLRKYTVPQSYQILQRVPKTTGGTEYEGVWKTIQNTPNNFVHFFITDFEYDLSSYMRFNPNAKECTNTYYLGFKDSWPEYVNDFAHQMFRAGDIQIYSHIYY